MNLRTTCLAWLYINLPCDLYLQVTLYVNASIDIGSVHFKLTGDAKYGKFPSSQGDALMPFG